MVTLAVVRRTLTPHLREPVAGRANGLSPRSGSALFVATPCPLKTGPAGSDGVCVRRARYLLAPLMVAVSACSTAATHTGTINTPSSASAVAAARAVRPAAGTVPARRCHVWGKVRCWQSTGPFTETERQVVAALATATGQTPRRAWRATPSARVPGKASRWQAVVAGHIVQAEIDEEVGGAAPHPTPLAKQLVVISVDPTA